MAKSRRAAIAKDQKGTPETTDAPEPAEKISAISGKTITEIIRSNSESIEDIVIKRIYSITKRFRDSEFGATFDSTLNESLHLIIYYNLANSLATIFEILSHPDPDDEEPEDYSKKLINFLKNLLNRNTTILVDAINNNAVDIIKLLYTKGVVSIPSIKEEKMHEAVTPETDIEEPKTIATINKALLHSAIENHAESSVAYLLKHLVLTPEERKKFADKACDLGNLAIVELLEIDPLYYLNRLIKMDKKPEEIAQAISLAYRFSSMSSVDELCVEFKKENPQREKLSTHVAIGKAREEFLKWGSQITRYYKKRDFHELTKVYNSDVEIKKEIEFGLGNFKVIEDLEKKKDFPEHYLRSEITENFPLPDGHTDNKPFYSMRTLVSIFSEARYEEAKRRGGDDADEYKTIRNPRSCITTPYYCIRYDHAAPFIQGMLALGKEKEKPSDVLYLEHEYFLLFDTGEKEKQRITKVLGLSNQRYPCWEHGRGEMQNIWKRIETLHAEVFKMKPDEIKQNPGNFYLKVIEVLWLMGNVTPLNRGTGRIVEQWLALVHRYHGFNAPILTKGLQLDCLDLTFSLSVYKKIFLDFFEPNSLPSFVVQYNIKQHNEDPETIRLAKHFQLSALPQSTHFNSSPRDIQPLVTPLQHRKRSRSTMYIGEPSQILSKSTVPAAAMAADLQASSSAPEPTLAAAPQCPDAFFYSFRQVQVQALCEQFSPHEVNKKRCIR